MYLQPADAIRATIPSFFRSVSDLIHDNKLMKTVDGMSEDDLVEIVSMCSSIMTSLVEITTACLSEITARRERNGTSDSP